jgi:hypothetical protein
MDGSSDSHDQSFGAETSHVEPVEEISIPTPREEELRAVFYKDDEASLEDEDVSVASAVLLATQKMLLADHEIRDEGDDHAREYGTFRYRLNSDLLRQTSRVAYDLQWYIAEAAALNPQRTKYFRVDPRDALIPSMEGATDPQQIRVAWDLL